MNELVWRFWDPPKGYDGVVYFILQTDNHRIKIGRTRNLYRRINLLKTNISAPYEILGTILSKDSGQLETYLHRKYADYRVWGEWFISNPDLMDYIAENAVYVPREVELV